MMQASQDYNRMNLGVEKGAGAQRSSPAVAAARLSVSVAKPVRLSRKSARAFAGDFGRRWTALCDAYAPRRDADDFWRFSAAEPLAVGQGWKIHLSATLLSAMQMFERCAPTLVRSGCHFKVAGSMAAIQKLNGGMAGRSQVGKIMTVYCPDPAKARALALELQDLTDGLPGPVVPSDQRLHPGSNVFYRYGAYDRLEIEIAGRKVPAYRDPTGNPVHDKRTKATAVPSWADDPFPADMSRDGATPRRREGVRYAAFKTLSWRARGGVFLARRIGDVAGPHYVMKEGLRHGEVGIDGRSGVDRIRNELRLLKSLSPALAVPAPVDFFHQDGNAYLVTEFVQGKNLDQVLSEGPLPMDERIAIARQMVEIVAALHAAGWCWRDCKTKNFVYADGRVWAIDFEFASRIRGRPALFAGTSGYVLEHQDVVSGRAAERQDLYALGTALHRVFAGLSDEEALTMASLPPLPPEVPAHISQLVASLRHEIPRRRLSAAFARGVFDQLATAGAKC